MAKWGIQSQMLYTLLLPVSICRKIGQEPDPYSFPILIVSSISILGQVYYTIGEEKAFTMTFLTFHWKEKRKKGN
jgi:hypothetical protein